MAETRVEAWDRLERENAELRRALAPFARVAVTPLRFAVVRYGTDTDPERQTFQTPTMHRAFNRAAEVLRAAKDGVPGRPPTKQEDAVLHHAARAAGKVVAQGKLAEGMAPGAPDPLAPFGRNGDGSPITMDGGA